MTVINEAALTKALAEMRSRDIATIDYAVETAIRAYLREEATPAQPVREDGWRGISTAPDDEWLLVATTGGWVGEAMTLEGAWKWASGHAFHSDIVPLKWMPLPVHPEVAPEVVVCLTDAEQKEQAKRCSCRGVDDYCPCQNVPDSQTIRSRKGV